LPEISDIPVHVTTGFTWTSFFTGISGASLLTILVLVIRQIGPWRKQRDEAEEKLRSALTKRVQRLERKIEIKDAKHEAERALDRHKIRNLNQCLDAVLMILETAPEKTVEVVAKVRTMRETQLAAEMREAGEIHAATIAAMARIDEDIPDDIDP